MQVKQLPVLLEPWRPWLSLFPADLAAPLGELLLRLHPQIGPLRSAPARADNLPEGVGSIVQRGPYERMLISEWAYADAEPDEFIRRAGSGELMFVGPEPAGRKRSRRCIALFDAGPAQLGEPRLLHLALFILLTRRAQEAGALFEWGILQKPTRLSGESGMHGIKRLLKGRTLVAVDAAALHAWASSIDANLDDLWIIGGHGLGFPIALRSQVEIRRSMLDAELDVILTMRRVARKLALALPPAALGTRLLRTPFAPLASVGTTRQMEGRPSLQQPPRFAAYSGWLAVLQLDGSVRVFQVPRSLKNAPGKAQHCPRPAAGSVLAAGVFGKALGCIVSDGDTLTFSGFPSEALTPEFATAARPPMDRFYAPPKMGRWLQTFFVRHTRGFGGTIEELHILALDLGRNLVCWSTKLDKVDGAFRASPLAFRSIGKNVIGAAQFDQKVLFACAREDTTDVYAWSSSLGSAQLASVPRTGTRLFFGDRLGWGDAYVNGLVALQCDDTDWLVGNGTEWATISVEPQAIVLGVAASARHAISGLVIRNKMTIELRSATARRILIKSHEKIAQASLDPATGNIAWIGDKTLSVCVQGLDQDHPYLVVKSDEAAYAN
jgi:hypothetical protein